MRIVAIFVVSNQSCNLSYQICLWIILLVAHIELFFLVNSHMQFGKIILEKCHILTVVNYIIILLLLLRNAIVIFIEELFERYWNHSSFLKRVM